MLTPSQYTCPHVSPYGQWLAYYAPSEGAVQLYRLSDGRNLMAPSQMGEPPVWSPHGEWITLRRKSPAAAMSAQIWVVWRDGTQARQLTDDERYFHSAPTWSPDGRTLVIQQVRLEGVNASSGIWLLDVTTGHLRELITPGTRPTWLH